MIELAYMSIEGISDADRELLYACVAPERREQLMARKNRLSADLSLAAEALARVMLCRIVRQLETERLMNGDCIPDDFPYSGGEPGIIQPKDFVIVRAGDGKPYQETAPGLYFNWSHSDTLVACGVAGEEIGVDIQKITDGGRVREKLFCPEELQEAEKATESSCFFTEVWAKKESYLKLTGEGLRRELKSLNVCRMQTDGEVQWYGGRISDAYYLYACVEGTTDENVSKNRSVGTQEEKRDGASGETRCTVCQISLKEITEFIESVQEA